MSRASFRAALVAAISTVGVLPVLLSRLLGHGLMGGLAAAGMIAVAAILGCRLARHIEQSVDGLLALMAACGERRFWKPGRPLATRSLDPLDRLERALRKMAHALMESERELIRRERLEGALSRSFPPRLAAEIAAGERSLSLNGERRRVSILFIEIVDYSTFAGFALPTQAVALLQEIYGMVSELIFRQGGILGKCMGDCMMGIFGALEPVGEHAQRALAAAEDIQRFMQANAPAWQRAYAFDVQAAIGVSSGDAVIGDMGNESGLEYTVLGDIVSAAARLAAIAHPGQVLTTQDVAAQIPPSSGFDLHTVDEQPMIGEKTVVKMFELT